MSTTLAGPIALAVGVALFRQLRATPTELARILWALLIPIAGLGSVVLVRTITNSPAAFTAQSNFATSGGFGPVQVSGALGLGVVIGLYLSLQPGDLAVRGLAFGLALWLGAQSALTFSRGGLWSAGIAVAVLGLHYLWRPRTAIVMLSLGGVAALLVIFIIGPKLLSFTDGAIGQRFSETSSSQRTNIAREDIGIWSEHVVAGVGPGMSRFFRPDEELASSHTEFTRMVAEHGSLGFVALAVLIGMALSTYWSAPGLAAKARVGALLAWSVSQMAYANLRIASVAFVFALAMLRLGAKPEPSERPELRLAHAGAG